MRVGQRRATIRLKARSKYGAVKTTVDGIVFHSKREAGRYGELKLLEKAGSIRHLQLQPKFRLSLVRDGVQRTLGFYIADFMYDELTETGGRWDLTVEDVKGVKTPLYTWKKKHMAAQYGIQIREI